MFETSIDKLCPTPSAVTNPNPSIDKEIYELTTHVRDYQEKLLLTLNARASLLRKAERLELALNDAYAMMNLVPSSPLGYLCAGGIDSQRGQYASAIQLYDDGLERSPQSHPHYAQLVKAREAAYDKKNKRIDFISKLPLDVVVHNIAPRILVGRKLVDLGKPYCYFDVCYAWRKRLALANELEYEVGPDNLTEDGYQRTYDLAPFMRSLKVIQPKQDIVQNRQTPLSQNGDVEEIGYYCLVLSSLRLLSSTLTDLDIEYGHRMQPMKRYRLCDIMEACPNLVSLRFIRGNVDMSSATKTYPKMVTLKLHDAHSHDKVYDGDMADVLHPFPELRSLEIYPISGTKIFPAVDKCCPLLQHLFVSGGCLSFPDVEETPERLGLRGLSIDNDSLVGNFREDDMVQYLMKHSETIEHLDILSTDRFTTPNYLLHQAASQQVTFKRLTRLSHAYAPEENLVSFLLWIIQHAPHLEWVETVACPYQRCIIQELLEPTHCHRLTRLSMRAPHSRFEDEERLIQHHLELGEQSNLLELGIWMPGLYLYDTSWLSLVPRLTQLTTLELLTISHNGFTSLNALLSPIAHGCPALEQITMTSYSHPVYYSYLDPMHDHRNLKRIVINSKEVHGEVASFCLLYQNLESLHLNVEKYNSEAIDRLDRAPFKFVFTPITSLHLYMFPDP